ncbi:MAG: hypothetical protein Q8764_02805 [Pigeon pea little leaf phytoplasma]|nr:hypothetical protein [Pigeon pea little leaf phytoplasma]MDV3154341.1 hypothetical protein [Pigeon pea little leaf phytoplasma]MDV3158394.1 hypothetical protein [Pigeon pea little leaf phytoplasma]MDV3158919.1 hypothetical protein [Pigeon pea little leaf phytoplasma]MDV3161786.1 hypothetical protein [Pigeon pea little leaf phytoplasma]
MEKQKQISSDLGKKVFQNKNDQNNDYYNFTLESEFIGYKCGRQRGLSFVLFNQ